MNIFTFTLKLIHSSSSLTKGMKVGSFIIAFLFTTSSFAAQTAENDTLLRVLREELAADFEELQKQELKPYFMSFRVQESFDARIIATFGFLGASEQNHKRTFSPPNTLGFAGAGQLQVQQPVQQWPNTHSPDRCFARCPSC